MIGDSACDIQAARGAGAQPILVLTGRGQITVNDAELIENVPIYENLAAFVNDFLSDDFITANSVEMNNRIEHKTHD